MNLIRSSCLFIFFLGHILPLHTQAQNGSIDLSEVPAKYFSKVENKINAVNRNLSRKSAKYLAKFERRQHKFVKKLRKINSEGILTKTEGEVREYSNTLANLASAQGFLKIKKNLSNKSPPESDEINNTTQNTEYNPYLDSLSTALNFLKQYNTAAGSKIKETITSLGGLKNNLQQAENVKAFLAERKDQLNEALSKFTNIPARLKKEYDQLSKTAYYYSAQVCEYKEMLKDPKKIEQKTLACLNKLPAFQKFMKENSQLASLFRIPSNYGSAENLAGLQTRSSVQALIQQKILAGGPNSQTQIQQNLAAAHSEMDKMKDKLNQLTGGNGDLQMPEFKPNSQKTKPLLKRLEYGFNVQFAKSNYFVPSAGDIALSIGYKLNDKSVIGVAASYRLGIGSIQHIQFTNQGLGFRSFLDWKLKKQFFISGGYEMNFNAAFKKIEELKNYNAWQRSALIGLTKKYAISKKVKGTLQFLYDFLAYRHIPVSQQFLFRTGYTF